MSQQRERVLKVEATACRTSVVSQASREHLTGGDSRLCGGGAGQAHLSVHGSFEVLAVCLVCLRGCDGEVESS